MYTIPVYDTLLATRIIGNDASQRAMIFVLQVYWNSTESVVQENICWLGPVMPLSRLYYH